MPGRAPSLAATDLDRVALPGECDLDAFEEFNAWTQDQYGLTFLDPVKFPPGPLPAGTTWLTGPVFANTRQRPAGLG